jgi:hypothetical protein
VEIEIKQKIELEAAAVVPGQLAVRVALTL